VHDGLVESRGRQWIEGLPAELSGQQALLRGLLRACESDDRFRWLAVACSVGRGAADRLSDLDMAIGVSDEQFDSTLADVRTVVDSLGDLVESYHHTLPEVVTAHERIFAQYADRGQMDLVVFPATQTIGQVRDVVVLYDQDDQVVVSFEQRPVTAAQAREWAFGCWCALIDIGKYLRRGSSWEALQRLQDARAQLWRVWAAGFDVPNPQYGLTSVLDFAPGRLPADMQATVSDLDLWRLLRAAQSLAAQLTDACEHLGPDLRATLPKAMERFVTADLAALEPVLPFSPPGWQDRA
jgi:hypothetical protein